MDFPLAIVIALVQKDKSSDKVKVPWFIGPFAMSIVAAYLFSNLKITFEHFYWLGKQGMVIALFIIDSSISISDAKEACVKSFILGVLF